MPDAIRDKDDFIARVVAIFGPEPPEDITGAIGGVFDGLDARLSPGAMAQLRGQMARDIRALFAD